MFTVDVKQQCNNNNKIFLPGASVIWLYSNMLRLEGGIHATLKLTWADLINPKSYQYVIINKELYRNTFRFIYINF